MGDVTYHVIDDPEEATVMGKVPIGKYHRQRKQLTNRLILKKSFTTQENQRTIA